MNNTTENRLERMLRLALEEPAHRPQFYQELLATDIYILGETQSASEKGEVHLKPSDKLLIQHWKINDGSTIIPFFSSLEGLQEAISSEETYLVLPAKYMLEVTLGSTLVLNPNSDLHKVFSKEEVQELLSNTLLPESTCQTVEENTQILLAQPNEPPVKLIDSLIQLYAKHTNIKRAYLALMIKKEGDNERLIIGLEVEGNGMTIEKVMRETGLVIENILPPPRCIDLYVIDEKVDGLSSYFINNVKPFYDVTWGARLNMYTGRGMA